MALTIDIIFYVELQFSPNEIKIEYSIDTVFQFMKYITWSNGHYQSKDEIGTIYILRRYLGYFREYRQFEMGSHIS